MSRLVRLGRGGPTGSSGSGTVSSGSSGAGAAARILCSMSVRAVRREELADGSAGGLPTPRRRVSWTRHSPGTKVCRDDVVGARSRHPGQSHTCVSTCGNRHCPWIRLCSGSSAVRCRRQPKHWDVALASRVGLSGAEEEDAGSVTTSTLCANETLLEAATHV